MSMKIPLTPAGIEPATFRFVVQHLNHCATAVPLYYIILHYIKVLMIVFSLSWISKEISVHKYSHKSSKIMDGITGDF